MKGGQKKQSKTWKKQYCTFRDGWVIINKDVKQSLKVQIQPNLKKGQIEIGIKQIKIAIYHGVLGFNGGSKVAYCWLQFVHWHGSEEAVTSHHVSFWHYEHHLVPVRIGSSSRCVVDFCFAGMDSIWNTSQKTAQSLLFQSVIQHVIRQFICAVLGISVWRVRQKCISGFVPYCLQRWVHDLELM